MQATRAPKPGLRFDAVLTPPLHIPNHSMLVSTDSNPFIALPRV